MSYNPNNPNGQATMANSAPVVIASNQTSIPIDDDGGSITIDGSVSVSNFPATQPVSGTVTVQQATAANLNATITGSVSVSNFPATQPVSGTVAATQSGAWNVGINNGAGASAVNIQDGGNSITVDGTVAATQSGTWNIGTLTSITNAVTVSGTVTASNTSGDVANDSPDSGNPVKIGFKADAVATLSGAVANGDRVDGVADRYGRQLVAHIDPSMQVWRSAEYTSAQTGTNIWVPTTGNRFVVTQINITTGGTTAGLVTIWGAATGTTAYTPGTDQVFFRGVLTPTANATPGALIQPPYPMFSDTTNDCLKITTSAAMTIYIQVYGYEITP